MGRKYILNKLKQAQHFILTKTENKDTGQVLNKTEQKLYFSYPQQKLFLPSVSYKPKGNARQKIQNIKQKAYFTV